MIKMLKDKRKGAAAFEWVILSPLIIIMFIVLLYVLFIALSYIQYNNLANTVAQDLNMRQTGYEEAIAQNPEVVSYFDNDQVTSDLEGFGHQVEGFDKSGNGITMDINVNPGDEKVVTAAAYSMANNIEKFNVPGSAVKSIDVVAKRNGEVASNFDNIKMSGTVIETTITYKIIGLEFQGQGYNVIS